MRLSGGSAVVMAFLVTMLGAPANGQDPSRAEQEIHLIPDGFAGVVTIAFRAGNGEATSYENGARLYRIPGTGLLHTQSDLNVGVSPAWRFFRVTANGARTPMSFVLGGPVANTGENRADPSIGIFVLGRGRLQSGPLPCAIDYEQYLVGTKAQMLAHDRVESIRRTQKALVSEFRCR